MIDTVVTPPYYARRESVPCKCKQMILPGSIYLEPKTHSPSAIVIILHPSAEASSFINAKGVSCWHRSPQNGHYQSRKLTPLQRASRPPTRGTGRTREMACLAATRAPHQQHGRTRAAYPGWRIQSERAGVILLYLTPIAWGAHGAHAAGYTLWPVWCGWRQMWQNDDMALEECICHSRALSLRSIWF